VARAIGGLSRLTNLFRHKDLLAIAGVGIFIGFSAWFFVLLPKLDYYFNPFNSDFMAFYTGGVLAGSGSDLYDLGIQYRIQSQAGMSLTADDMLPFLYPPFASLYFMPFAAIPFAAAYWLWTLASAVAYLAGTLIWARSTGWTSRRWSFVLGGLGYLPLFYLLILGQTTIHLFLLLVLALVAFTARRDFVAGLFIGFLSARPILIGVWLAVLVRARRWAALAGAMIAITGLILASLSIWGLGIWTDWIQLLGEIERGLITTHSDKIGSMTSIRGWLSRSTHLSTDAVLLLSGLASVPVFGVTLLAWRTSWQPESEQFAWSLAATLLCVTLISPHSNLHMTFLLWAGALWISSATRTTGAAWILITFGSFLFLLVFSVGFGQSLTTPALMAAWSACVFRAYRAERIVPHPRGAVSEL
jgi:hypothetical protein